LQLALRICILLRQVKPKTLYGTTGGVVAGVEKAFAYVTRGRSLLAFRHVDYPEAGIQVPAGTIGAQESGETAVLREVHEETGLEIPNIRAYLGSADFTYPTEPTKTVRRHFFHLSLTGPAPDRWRHWEHAPSVGSDAAILFELYWVPLDSSDLGLAPGHDAFLSELRAGLPELAC
jgi:8-oxo-dGTP pyrophosphatase MutT (NUDIX family)